MSLSGQRGQFPATSIGRSTGSRVAQPPTAHEAHPLLFSSGSTSPPATAETTNGAPKYLPYTPRQRIVAAATTTSTGATVCPPSSPQVQGNATTKLQLMHLKAAAQNIGLDTSTVGWAILEKLVAYNEGDDWNEIWGLITSGKATLFLPLEQQSGNERVTAAFIKDHIVVIDDAAVVTSSGLRGSLEDDVLTLRSTISPTSKLFQDLLSPVTRQTTFPLLPPLPSIPDSAPYPRLTIVSECTVLPLPPRAHAGNKPSLPPRPTGRSTAGNASASRIPNPFASFFGGSGSKAPSSPTTLTPTSPPASIRSFDSSQDSGLPVDITVFTVDRKIVRHEVAKQINKALKGEIKGMLASCSTANTVFPVPSWVNDRVNDFTVDWFPFVRVKTKGRDAPNVLEKPGSRDREYEVNRPEENSDEAADRVQEFLMLLEQDLRAAGTPFLHRRMSGDSNFDVEKERERREREGIQVEMRVREVIETVERIVCSLFYERIFMQPTTDDASHDEALNSRIGALNMMDLTLSHLDVLVGDNASEVDVVVKACGEMLSQIDECRCPADKAAILVAAHKVVVDGLSRLPPIRLKSESKGEPVNEEDLQTAKPAQAPAPYTQEQEKADPGSHAPIPETSPAVEEKDVPSDGLPSPLILPTANLPDATPTSPITGSNNEQSPDNTSCTKENSKRPAPLTLDMPARPKEPTPVSGDILLPMLIFSVAKANPPRLLSNLLFTQRFRNQSVGGEESYCLINLMAVAEFLENVDIEAIGLGDGSKVMSAADLTPIPLARSPVTAETPLVPGDTLRGRVEQQVDAIADSANKVISGVVDSSFGILRSFLPQQGPGSTSQAPSNHGGSQPPTPGGADATAGTSSSWRSPRQGFGLLRRESGFSLASIAANLPIAGRTRAGAGNGEEAGQQLITVSRPGSVQSRPRSRTSLKIRVDGESSQDSDGDESESATSTTDDYGGREGVSIYGDEFGTQSPMGDTRSIKSFENMLASSKREPMKQTLKDVTKGLLTVVPVPGSSNNPSPVSTTGRTSISDRLARVTTFASSIKGSPATNSLLLHPPSASQSTRRLSESPASSRSPSPILQPASLPPLRLAPPIQKFMESSPGDLRLSEIGELLRDYRRIVEGVRAAGGFDE